MRLMVLRRNRSSVRSGALPFPFRNEPMHDDNRDCAPTDTRRLLASSNVATVEACSCGVVHVHLGPMTLRFTEASLHRLQSTLAQACAGLLPEGLNERASLLHATQQPRGLA